jgi:hypothetical protein
MYDEIFTMNVGAREAKVRVRASIHKWMFTPAETPVAEPCHEASTKYSLPTKGESRSLGGGATTRNNKKIKIKITIKLTIRNEL